MRSAMFFFDRLLHAPMSRVIKCSGKMGDFYVWNIVNQMDCVFKNLSCLCMYKIFIIMKKERKSLNKTIIKIFSHLYTGELFKEAL